LRDSLSRGDVPVRLAGPSSENNAVWLTTEPQPEGHGLSDARVLTEPERQTAFETFGFVPPQGAKLADEKAIRIKVVIPSSDPAIGGLEGGSLRT
jgi:hypothetical protein